MAAYTVTPLLRHNAGGGIISAILVKVVAQGTPIIKQVLPPEKEKRSTDDLFVLLFTCLALQGIVCYTYKSVLSGGKYK